MDIILKRVLMTVAAIFCIAASSITLNSCDKIEDLDGMNDARAYYNYRAKAYGFDYQEVAGPFDTAIRTAGGWDPIMGGDDEKIIDACNECYETLKVRLRGKSGKVEIFKIRHPDGKEKVLKTYKF